MIVRKSIRAVVDNTMAIFPNHLAATPRPTTLLPPLPLLLLAARWFPHFGRCPGKANRSVASAPGLHLSL